MSSSSQEMTGAIDWDAGRAIVARSDHGCFGCGRLNPRGIQLAFRALPDESGVWAPFTPAREFEGYTGVVHGGIVTTVLDEVMAWALYARGIWAVTGEITVRFRRPVEIAEPTRAIGRLVAERGRTITTAAELRRVEDDALLASASATFVRVGEEQAAAWRDRYIC